MDTYEEDQQIEIIKEWWAEYGKSVVFGVVLAVGVVGSWKFWEYDQTQKGERASAIYYEMQSSFESVLFLSNAEEKDEEALEAAKAEFQVSAGQLKTDFPKSEYARYAALNQAKLHVEANNLDGAEEELRWVLTQSPSESLKFLTSERLMRVLIANSKYDEALKIGELKNTGTYAASFDELRGDALVGKGDLDGALLAYQEALGAVIGNKNNLEMKYYSLLKSDAQSDKPANDPSDS